MSSGFFKLVVYFFIAYLIYLAVRFVFGASRKSRRKPPPRRLSGTMVRDEVCDTYLPQEDAVRANVGGVDYFFCSRECRDKFIEQKRNNRPDAV